MPCPNYYLNGPIFNPMRQGNTLWANCEGNTTYQPKVTLGAQGVEDSSCTCPYDWGGLCKHQVALLLTYVRDRHKTLRALKEELDRAGL